MIRLNQIGIPINAKQDIPAKLDSEIKNRLRIKDYKSYTIYKKSIDARKKPNLKWIYSVDVSVDNEQEVMKRCRDKNAAIICEKSYDLMVSSSGNSDIRPIIVGMGPCGLFCAYMLAKHGYKPIVLERGKCVRDRLDDVKAFWESGVLDTASNVQFGEGGAGTFSDGKLNTLIKDKSGRNREVLKIFTTHGAPESILYDSKPHIGTDILIDVVESMRNKIVEWGGEVRFESQVTDFIIDKVTSSVKGVILADNTKIMSEIVILAPGHSARDTFAVLHSKNVPMEAKAFAVGYRVSHPQSMIDINQYGVEGSELNLPAASYKLTHQSANGRGVYSFCMCPGGYVVNSSSEESRLAINGMSYHDRDSGYANSAIIMSVTPDDYPGSGPLAGVEFQRAIEARAYEIGKGRIPVQKYVDFKHKRVSTTNVDAQNELRFKGAYTFTDLHGILPEALEESFVEGMESFDTIIDGFAGEKCIMAGIESRTSSPVRISRDDSCQSAIRGLYPCGEGAGYAGGITSAAMDGLLIAEKVAHRLNNIKED